MESEYIIVYDENGEPHLEHAWLRRGQAHKYIMKIGEGLKARYFYTQAEVDAYMNRGKQKAQNTADKIKNGVDRAAFETKINARRVKNATENAVEKKITGNKSQYNRNLMQKNAEYNERMAKYAPANSETRKFHEEAAKKSRERAELYNQEYKKSLAGKAENAANEVKNNVKSAAKRLNENTKSKMDKMREEFRKDADSVKDAATKAASEVKAKSFDKKAEKLQNKADDLNKKAFNDTSKQKDAAQAQIDANNAKIKSLEEDAKASEHKTNKAAIDKLKAQNDDLKDVADGNEIREQFVEEKFVTEEEPKSNQRNNITGKHAKYGEYTKGDPDFDDKNFDEKNRAGDSDFFIAFRPDGSSVILEEDMKWVLPKGVNPRDPAIVSALNKDFEAGSNEEWVKQVTEAIDEAVDKERSKYPDPNKMRKSNSNK